MEPAASTSTRTPPCPSHRLPQGFLPASLPLQTLNRFGRTVLTGDYMASINGFGGVFLRADDPKALYQWYEQHLGLVKSGGAFSFPAPPRHPEVIFPFSN